MSQIVHLEQSRKFEKIKTSIFNDTLQASEVVATKIAETIKGRASINKHVVLGLATGSTGIKVYEHLVNLHKNDGLRFSNVITFNLDEYFPMQPNSIQSYRRFMDEHLFNHVDIKKENIHIPDGTINPDQVVEYCRAYEDRIDKLGGIDLQILGIGRRSRGRSYPTSKARGERPPQLRHVRFLSSYVRLSSRSRHSRYGPRLPLMNIPLEFGRGNLR